MGHYVTWQEAMVAMACYSTLLVKYSSIWAKTGFADVQIHVSAIPFLKFIFHGHIQQTDSGSGHEPLVSRATSSSLTLVNAVGAQL